MHGSFAIYLIIYVDDIITTGSDLSGIASLVKALKDEFAIRDLGQANFFLGIEISSHQDGYILTQQKYILDIFQKARMHDAQPISMPLAINVNFGSSSPPFKDPT